MTCTETSFAAPRFAPSAPVQPLTWVARVVRGLDRALRLGAQRRVLRSLDDRMLADIGLTREAALRECDRPVWDSPAHWRA